MAEEKEVTGVGGPETAVPEQAPPNVVKDNSGQVPVQPIATTDPTLNDNTNPKIPFDGADPRNIPPHDSNEQLHIAAGKRADADGGTLGGSEAKRREAVEAAYDNSRDVRDVLDTGDDNKTASDDPAAERRAAAQRVAGAGGARVAPPKNRSNVDPKTARA